MSLARLWAVLAVALPALGALLAGLSTTDLAYHLRAGGEILDGRGIPRTDTWTYTVAGQPWHDQQWLAQALLALAYRTSGWVGLAVLRAAMVGAIFGLVALAARRQGVGIRQATGLAIAAFVVSAVALALRPQLFGMLLFAIVLFIVAERERRPRWLWAVVPLTAVWANLHGSFVFGPLLLLVTALGDRMDGRGAGQGSSLLAAAIASAGAALLNPWGAAVWTYAAGLTTSDVVRSRVMEWQPTSLRDVPGLLFFASVAVLVTFLARRRQAAPWVALITLGVFAAVGTYAVRGLAWWPLAAAVVVAPLVARVGTQREEAGERRTTAGARRVNAAVALGLIAAGVAILPTWRPVDSGLGAPEGLLGQAPSGVTAALRAIVVGEEKLFAPQPWGSWLEFALPQAKVAVDSRIELFPDEVWRAHDRVVDGGPDALRQLEAWDVSVVVISEPSGATPLTRDLQAAGWAVAFSDADASILVRRR